MTLNGPSQIHSLLDRVRWMGYGTGVGGAGTGYAYATPTGLQATAGDGEVALVWTRHSQTQQWFVYRNTTNNFATATQIEFGTTATNASPPQPSPSYIDATAVNGTTYYYWVLAVSDVSGGPVPDFVAGSSSDHSTVASATPDAGQGSFLMTEGGNPITTEARTPIIPEI